MALFQRSFPSWAWTRSPNPSCLQGAGASHHVGHHAAAQGAQASDGRRSQEATSCLPALRRIADEVSYPAVRALAVASRTPLPLSRGSYPGALPPHVVERAAAAAERHDLALLQSPSLNKGLVTQIMEFFVTPCSAGSSRCFKNEDFQ